jgi:hypothetical protein
MYAYKLNIWGEKFLWVASVLEASVITSNVWETVKGTENKCNKQDVATTEMLCI